MPLHLIQKDKDTEANILAIGAAMNACPGQFYFAEDAGYYYFGLDDGTLKGPLPSSGGGSTESGVIPGPYAGDTEADAAGVGGGQRYRLSQINDYDIPSPGGRTVVVNTTSAIAGTVVPGPFSGDTEAALNNVSPGTEYRLKQINDYEIPSPGARTVVARVS